MTPAFDRFVQPARDHPQIWRLLAGAALCAAIYLAYAQVLFLAFDWFTGGAILTLVSTPTISQAAEATGTLLLLATFPGIALGTFAAARWLHRRPIRSLFGPPSRMLRDFATASGIASAVLGLALGVWCLVFDAMPNLDWVSWLALLPLTLIGVLAQTGSEELLFRGYMQTQLAARFRTSAVWLLLPSLLFGLVHFNPVTTGDNTWLLVVIAAVFGLLAADLTALTGSLGAAWGFHFANNTFALALLATDGTITGLSRYVTPYAIDESGHARTLICIEFLLLLVAWLLVRRAVTR